jgi:hypothetical protein
MADALEVFDVERSTEALPEHDVIVPEKSGINKVQTKEYVTIRVERLSRMTPR